MDQQFKLLCESCAINFEHANAFDDATILSSKFYQNEGYWKIMIGLTKLVDPKSLYEFESKLETNLDFPVKFVLQVQEPDYDLNKVWAYLQYIKEHKAEVKNSYFIQLPKEAFSLTDQVVTITVDNTLARDLLEEHLAYYQQKLRKYGFANIQFDVQLVEVYNDILDQKKQNLESHLQQAKQKQEAQPQPGLNQTPGVNNKPTGKTYGGQHRTKADLSQKTYPQIKDITIDEQNVVLHGEVIKLDGILTKNKKWIMTVTITDYSDSIDIKMFSRDENKPVELEGIKVGSWIAVLGDVRYDMYAKEQVFFSRKLEPIDSPFAQVVDEAPVKRVELHAHTKMSTMDGVGAVGDYFNYANQLGHKAIAFTDHLNLQSYPEIYNTAKKYPNVKPIYGVEFDVVNNNIKYAWNTKKQDLRSAKYVVFDLETTGLSSEFDEIIEFGAVVFTGMGGERKTYDFLIKPRTQLSNFTTELTGITEAMLRDKPTIEEIFPQIRELCADAILVAHNATFDTGFLQSWAQKLGYPAFDNTVIDTLPMSRSMIKELKNYRLGTVCRKLNIDYNEEVAHRADYDAEVLTGVYENLLMMLHSDYNVLLDSEIAQIQTPECFRKERPFHLTVLARNQAGLKTLFNLVSTTNTDQFFSSPKLLRDTLTANRENLLIGTSCVNGEVFETARNKSRTELLEVMKYYDYVEVQPPSVYKHLVQREGFGIERIYAIITNIIECAKELNKPVVASGDVHYIHQRDKILREVYINTKGIGGRPHPLFDYRHKNIDYPEQHYRTTKEMLQEFKFLNDPALIEEIVITNPSQIADMIEPIQVIKDRLYTPTISDADRLLREKCYETAHAKYGAQLPEVVEQRLERELQSIIKHGFAVIYWIAHKLVERSLQDGYLVGSRGSVGSSFVATMANITEVNPLQPHYLCPHCQYSEFLTDGTVACGYDLENKECPNCHQMMRGEGHDIPFETFLGFEADKVPDIDLNFSGDYQPRAHDFTKEMFGEKYVYRAGTISTVAEKTAFGYVKGYFENTNRISQLRRAELERLAKACEGVKRTTGQHPGGIVVIPKEYDVEDFTPVNYPADDQSSSWLTTHFDFHAIHDNVLKLDILGHVDPTALRMLQDLTGVDPKTIGTYDPQVLSLFTNLSALGIDSSDINGEPTGAIGIPEFGTQFVRKMLLDTKPKSFADLVQISGLSHGTDVWLGNAQELIRAGKANISQVIGCRDDIMVRLIYKGLPKKQAFAIMEDVRKGKGLKPEQEALMREYKVEDWYIDSCKKIKYMFPKAHATAYVLMAWRIAWYKINFPHEYYATYFSTRTDVFDIKSILKGPAVIASLINDITARGEIKGFSENKPSQKEKDLIPVYELALEMWARKIKIVNIDLNLSDANNFRVMDLNGEKTILPPFSCIDGLGTAVAQSIVNARNEKEIKSISDLKKRTGVTKAHLATFEELGILDNLAEDEQMKLEF